MKLITDNTLKLFLITAEINGNDFGLFVRSNTPKSAAAAWLAWVSDQGYEPTLDDIIALRLVPKVNGDEGPVAWQSLEDFKDALESDQTEVSTHVAVNSEVPILESSNPNWQGPVSLSLSFFSGDYVNASVEKGVPNYEVSEAVKQCRGLLKKGAKKGAEAQGFGAGFQGCAGIKHQSIRGKI